MLGDETGRRWGPASRDSGYGCGRGVTGPRVSGFKPWLYLGREQKKHQGSGGKGLSKLWKIPSKDLTQLNPKICF